MANDLKTKALTAGGIAVAACLAYRMVFGSEAAPEEAPKPYVKIDGNATRKGNGKS